MGLQAGRISSTLAFILFSQFSMKGRSRLFNPTLKRYRLKPAQKVYEFACNESHIVSKSCPSISRSFDTFSSVSSLSFWRASFRKRSAFSRRDRAHDGFIGVLTRGGSMLSLRGDMVLVVPFDIFLPITNVFEYFFSPHIPTGSSLRKRFRPESPLKCHFKQPEPPCADRRGWEGLANFRTQALLAVAGATSRADAALSISWEAAALDEALVAPAGGLNWSNALERSCLQAMSCTVCPASAVDVRPTVAHRAAPGARSCRLGASAEPGVGAALAVPLREAYQPLHQMPQRFNN